MPGRVEIALLGVLIRNDTRLGRPPDRKTGVIPSHTALAFRRVKRGDQVERLRIFFEGQKAVCKATRHVHHAAVLGAELGAEALPKTRRARPQIEDRVPQRAAHTAHDLHLRRLAQLVMHAAQRALVFAQRVVDLHKAGIESSCREFPLAIDAGKKTAVVFAFVELDDKGPVERCRHKSHGISQAVFRCGSPATLSRRWRRVRNRTNWSPSKSRAEKPCARYRASSSSIPAASVYSSRKSGKSIPSLVKSTR